MSLKKHSIPAILLIVFGISIFMQSFWAVITVTVLAILMLEYHLFYTQRPYIAPFFLISGLVITAMNLYQGNPNITGVFIVIVFLECIRVFGMALLRYPSTISELEHLTEELEKRVEQRTEELSRANQQLAHANSELQQLDKMKTSFVSQASHDLRTPLTAIKGSLDNLSLGIAGELSEKQQKILQRAIHSVDRLTDLINDILDLNRIESGRVVLEKRDFSIRDCISNLVLENKPAADQKHIQLVFHKNEEPYTVHADQGKMERVIGELIGNAIKYTHENGMVSIEICKDESNIAVCVQDNGMGLSPESCAKIWERFYRVPEAQHTAKGSGLGLSIAKEIVEMHEGQIWVESEIGKGTAFQIKLPVDVNRTTPSSQNEYK